MSYIQELRALVGHRPLIFVTAGVLILDNQGRLLLQRRADNGLWGVPGGCMEIGETLEETARREVREETGLEVQELALFDVVSDGEIYTYPNGDQANIVSVLYRATRIEGDLAADSDESLELRFFSVDELSTLPLSGQNCAIVRRFLQAQA